ncbi:MAG: hypothetical protein WCI05_02670 [Myxococcales bacterium]
MRTAHVNASPLLSRIAAALAHQRLEAILIGNAAAALHGAPVTTLDFDFFFRDTPHNRKKLKAVATELGAAVFRPYYPVSSLFRVIADDSGLQLDFMSVAHGVHSFEGLRARATLVEFSGNALRVASLDDIIKSKRAAGRPRDIAVLPVLEATREEQKASKT